MKKVVVMTTGGTIAMKYDPVTQGLIPAVGNPLKSSPDFPPLCTERAAFTALGAPSNSDVRASNTTYTLRYSFKFKD